MNEATQTSPPENAKPQRAGHARPGIARSLLRSTPGVLISAVLHGVLLLGAALLYIERSFVDDDSAFITQIRRPDTKIDPTLNAPPQPKKPPTEEKTQPQDDALTQDPGTPTDPGSESVGSQDSSTDLGAAPIGVAGLYSTGGSGSGGYRSSASRIGGGSKGKPKAVTDKQLKAALSWLARHQDPRGSWSTLEFHKNCGRYGFSEDCVRGEPAGNEQYDVGITGLALLAFLGGGYGPTSREPIDPTPADPREAKEILGSDKAVTYGDVVKRACKYLLSVQDSSGRIGPEVDRYIHNHLLATLALTEAYGITRVWLLRQPALKGIQFLIDSRSPSSGWGYTPRSAEVNSTVTGWAVSVLRSAEASGLYVDDTIFADVCKWFDQVTVTANVPKKIMGSSVWDESRKLLLTGYLSPKDAGKLVIIPGFSETYQFTPTLTAIMLLSTAFAGGKSAANVQGAIDTLLAFQPSRWSLEDHESWKRADFYYWYHATHALSLHLGKDDPRWKTWSEALRVGLFETQCLKGFEGQCKEGSWEPIDRWACEGGRVYATAMAAMTIEVYYRFPKVIGLARNEKPIHVDGE